MENKHTFKPGDVVFYYGGPNDAFTTEVYAVHEGHIDIMMDRNQYMGVHPSTLKPASGNTPYYKLFDKYAAL